MIKGIEKLRLYAQSIHITFESWILSFAGIVLIRIFLEQYSSFIPRHFILIDVPTIVHYSVFFLASIVLLMIILRLLTKTSIKELSVICLMGLFVLWIVPLIDLAVGGVGGHILTYPLLTLKELFLRFVTFFGGHITFGATLGVQVEIIMVMIVCYLYVYIATKNIIRAIGASLAFYCLIFFLGSIPSLIALFFPQYHEPMTAITQSMTSSHIVENNIHPDFSGTYLGLFNLAFNKTMIGIYTIIAILSSGFLFFLTARKKFIALMKNCRPERIFHVFLLFTLGAALAHTAWFTSWIDIQSYILALIAFFCAGMFSICQNDIHDETIDAISNPNRPLISKELSRNDMEMASKIFLIFAILSAYASSHYLLFFVSLSMFAYYIYSNPPLRLKRFVILSSILVSLAHLSVILAGFFLLSPDKNIIAFPFSLVVAIIVFFTIISNVRDIKDEDGDRTGGIKTLPVLLGLKKSKKIIAGMGCFLFLLIPWYFYISSLLIPSIIVAILSWHFVTTENYKEWKVFTVYLIYLILIIGAIAFQ